MFIKAYLGNSEAVTWQMDYYVSHTRTIANSIELAVQKEEQPHFPDEGLCIGSLRLSDTQLPALIDLFESKGLCFLYDSANQREIVNRCLERIAWRMSLCLPTNLCEFIVYNGGNPGDNFNTLNKLPQSFFKTKHKVLFDANSEEFTTVLSLIYQEIAERITTIKDFDKSNLFELNESEGADARIKYTILTISDLPHVTVEQNKLLAKIVAADCSKSGVFVFCSWDMNAQIEKGYGSSFDYQAMLNALTLLFPKNERFYFRNSGNDALMNKFMLQLDSDTISKDKQQDWLNTLNTRIQKATSTSLDIRAKLLTPDTMWSKTSSHGLEIPIGNVTSSEAMNLEFCPQRDSTIVHGLIGGTSGSGKSTLLHDIIINGAWLYSPDELQFILLDFKSVEFGIYAGLPHVKVMSTKSDREYGSNVLAYITKEIEHRKKLFGRASSIEEYNAAEHHVPRLLVIIDEFHNLFVNEGAIGDLRDTNLSSFINNNFNKILKEGRAFGIHLLLATQEVGGIRSIESYLQQIKLRIALKLEVKGMFLADNNSARPDRLRRGEGIYNDDFGKEGSNHSFRFTFYGNEKRTHKQVIETEMIEPIRKKSIEVYDTYSPCEKCFYRGGGESTIEDNAEVVTQVNDEKCVIYVGSPITVRREDVSFELKRKRGFNIIIIGATSNYLESLIRLTFTQGIRQSNTNSKFLMCLSSNDEFEYGSHSFDSIELYKDNDGLIAVIQQLTSHLEARRDKQESPSDRIVFALMGLRFFDEIERNAELKKQIENIIIKGPEYGIHSILHSIRFSEFEKSFAQDFCDLQAITPSELLSEFNIRIALKSDDGHKLYANQSMLSSSPQEDFLANIQTKDSGAITKFSIYQQ